MEIRSGLYEHVARQQFEYHHLGADRAGQLCPWSSNGNTTGFTCQKTPVNGSSTTSTIPSSGTYSGYICPTIDQGDKDTTKLGLYYNGCYNSTAASRTISSGSSASCGSTVSCSCSGSGSHKVCTQSYYTHTWISNATSTWTGCVSDRGSTTVPGTTAGNDQTVTAPTISDTTTLFPARNDTYCPPATVSGLSYNWTSMTATVNSLSPNGSTNQPIGLVTAGNRSWASARSPRPADGHRLHLLAGDHPAVGRLEHAGPLVRQRLRHQHLGRLSHVQLDRTGTCANIKAAGITIYTIQVNTGGDPTSTLLPNCASNSTEVLHADIGQPDRDRRSPPSAQT